MKFVICLSFLTIATAVVSGQDAGTDQELCDEDFITAFKNGKEICFKPEEKEVAETLLGQPAPASVREILRRRRSDNDKGCKKDWLNDPEKLKQMTEKIECLEKEVEHTPLYEKIKSDCDKEIAEMTDETENKQLSELMCKKNKMHKVCGGKLGGHGGEDGNRKSRPKQ